MAFPMSGEESRAVELVHARFQDAFNRQDVDGITALYHPDAVLLSGGGPIRGLPAIRAFYREAVRLCPTIELHTLRVTQSGGIALLEGRWTLQETAGGGVHAMRDGWNAEVVSLQPDGRWLFVIDDPLLERHDRSTP